MRGCPERRGGFEEFCILGEAQIEVGERVDGRARDEEIEDGCLRTDLEAEGAGGAEAQATKRGKESFAKVVFGEAGLRPGLQGIAADEVVIAGVGRGRLRRRGLGRKMGRESKGRRCQGCGEKIAALHAYLRW